MNKRVLDILKSLTENGSGRQKRVLETLRRSPEAEFSKGWFMCVPICFNGALDILRTERSVGGSKGLSWTQGAAFSFSEGDTLYDTPSAYTEAWSAALKSISLCVQVTQARPALSGSDDGSRDPGSVTLDFLVPDEQKIRLIRHCRGHIMSQDAFVRFLIEGPNDELSAKLLTR